MFDILTVDDTYQRIHENIQYVAQTKRTPQPHISQSTEYLLIHETIEIIQKTYKLFIHYIIRAVRIS